MMTEREKPKEPLVETPKSLFIIAHLATHGGIGDLVVLSTVASRLQRAGIAKVGLGYNGESGSQFQVTQLISPEGIEFLPMPEGLFDPELSAFSFWKRLGYYFDSLEFQRSLLGYDRIALLGASAVRFLKKSPLFFRLDTFPKDVFKEDQLLADNYTHQLGEKYGIDDKLDQMPVDLSIPLKHEIAVADLASEMGLDLSSPFWVVNLRTGRPEKTWPLERFITLSRWLNEEKNKSIVLINPPETFYEWQSLREQVGPRVHLFLSAELGETAALLNSAAGYIGGDTGVTHIAAAMEIPLVCLYPEVNLRVWRPVTEGQKAIFISGEAIVDITPEQVMAILEAHSEFFE